MKKHSVLLAAILILSIGLCLIACGQKTVNLQTQDDAIEYLENYVEKNDRWRKVADELGLYYSVKGSEKFHSSSYANLEDGTWVVVLHVSMDGYTDYEKNNYGSFECSYIAKVTTDGQVTELLIQQGHVVDVKVN